MYKVYFTRKGHTKSLNIPNVWPTKNLSQSPDECLHNGLVALIDPILNDRTYYTATLTVYDTDMWERQPDYWGRSYLLIGNSCVWGASMIKGHLSMNSHTPHVDSLLTMTAQELEEFWMRREAGLRVLHAAVEEFKRYFPRQE